IEIYDYQSNYWLYHHLVKYIKHSCIDVLRKEGLTKENYNHTNKLFQFAGTFEYEKGSTYSMEDIIIESIALQEAIEKLSEDELKVFNVFLHADNIEAVTLSYICSEAGIKYRQQAK